jgi:indole-3-acetate monooxygenase
MDDLFRMAAELGRRADQRWAELDRDCRLPADLHEAALVAGLFRTLVPVELGGVGVTPLEWFRVGIELARHEASFGWVVTQGAVELGYIATGGDPGWASELLSDPLASSASSVGGMGTLRIGPSGATFGGRWSFNTGAHGATWIGGLARVEGGTTPDVRLAWVPADCATILDDWDPSGLRGSGSNSTVIPEQPIDQAWILRPFAAVANDRGPYRCLLGNGNWPIACSVAATQLGAARRAIDEAAAVVHAKAPAPDFVPLAQHPVVQRKLLSAEGMWNACRASVERELESMWAEAVGDGALSTPQRVRLFAANALASEQSLRIINIMCDLTGTVSINRGHPLSRARRDAQALRGHRATNGEAVEHAGKVWLGLIPEHRRI